MSEIAELNRALDTNKILLPVARICNEVTHKKPTEILKPLSKATTDEIQALFPEQEPVADKIKHAQKTLGKLADKFNHDELRDLVAQVEYLAESWLDGFERDIFKGMTLKELLHERSV